MANELYNSWSQRDLRSETNHSHICASTIYKQELKNLFHLPDLNEHFRY